MSYGSTVLYDVVVFFLTLVRLRSAALLNDSAIGRKLYIDSMVYVAVAAALNTTVVVVQLLPENYHFLKPTVVPFSVVVTVRIWALFLRLSVD
jgi:hypothetical protein